MELPNDAFFCLLATVAMITVKMHFTHFHRISCQGNYSFIKIIKPISQNNNWENGVKHIKITEEKSLQTCTLCQLLRTKTLSIRVKMHQNFF